MARLSSEEVSLEEKQKILDERVKANELTRGNILDKNGISIFSGEDYSDREYFKKAMGGESCVSEPLTSKTTGKTSIIIAAPMWEDGVLGTQVVGVVFLVPEETFLNDIMVSTNVSENGSAYMVDKDGAVIAHKDMELVEKKENSILDAETDPKLKSLAKLEKKMIAGETGFGMYRYGGMKKIMAYAPVENTNGWSIAITAPLSDFNLETIVGIVLTMVIVVAAIAFSVSIVKKLAENIGTPIRRCAERLEGLARGDLHTPIPQIESRNEIGTLLKASEVLLEEFGEIIGDIKYLLGEMSSGQGEIPDRR